MMRTGKAMSGSARAPRDAQSSRAVSDEWRKVLVDGHAPLVWARRAFRYMPSAPRCKVCNNPFAGVGGRVLGLAGFRRSRKNPNLCSRCCDSLPVGGAEVDIAVLFADVRGSVGLGEQLSPAEFADLLNRFYTVAVQTLVRHDAVIDKLIGDQVMAFFVEGISGPQYRRKAIDAAGDLLDAVGRQGLGLAVGASVSAGTAYVGNVGEDVVDFTALGDPVNVGARMQAVAATGELLIRQGVDDELVASLPRRTLTLRGHEEPVDVFVADSSQLHFAPQRNTRRLRA
jgi:adenylate cyclase